MEECLQVAPGKGIGDSGSTKPLMGADAWAVWKQLLEEKGYVEDMETAGCSQRFHSGGGEVKVSKMMITFPVCVSQQIRVID